MQTAMDKATARNYDLNGWFEIKGNPLSKVGVFPYSGAQVGAPAQDAGKVFRVYRPAEELASPETIASFRLAPIINDHVMLGDGFTNAEDKGIEGVIGEDVYFSEDMLRGNIKIYSKALADEIKNGKDELSCGYRCIYDFSPGTWNGQEYDVIQRHIRGNHLALVDEGRMGPDVSVLDHLVFTIDAKETTSVDKDLEKALAPVMDSINKLSASVAALQTAHDAAVEKAKADEEAAKTAADDLPPDVTEEVAASMDAALKKIAALEGEIAALKSAPAMDEATIVATAASRSDLVERLSKHVGTFDHARMTLAQVAEYGVTKLEIKGVTKGNELTALDAYLQAKPVSAPVATAADSNARPTGSIASHFAPVAAV